MASGGDGGCRGRIDRCIIQTSRDGSTWTPAIPESRFPNGTDPQEILFGKPIVARHIRILAFSDHGGAAAAAVAELEPLPDLAADSRQLGIIPGFNDGK